ncbi:MAG: glucose-6-phosphate isomerase [Gammaproteobacteria bacterium]|nr:glucose-6-phosphate isomerase [Gammaproteobacteria bacterium]
MQQAYPSVNPASLPAWQALLQQHAAMRNYSMQAAFDADPGRFEQMSIRHQDMLLDYSKNLTDSTTLSLLVQLAEQAGVPQALRAQYEGAILNTTEHRAALHSALRRSAGDSLMFEGEDIVASVHQVHEHMERLVNQLHSGQWTGFDGQAITDVVNIGIGGSFLGPQLAVEALQPFATGHLRCHFLANIDSSEFHQISRQIDPARTLFIVSSKSFGTLETLKNAQAARQWMLDHGCAEAQLARHFIAVSSNVAKAVAFGIAEENILPMWDWVGGRYSMWSAIGLPIALSVGMGHFRAMLDGARQMDQHALSAPLAENMPVIMALLGIWYTNFHGAQSHAVLAYDNYLQSLPDYLQQLDMESNGKRVRHDGQPLAYASGPVIWGNIGTNGQHAYHQLLLQGTQMIPADFIIAARSQNPVADHHQWLFANCLSQSQALMLGKPLARAEDELRQKGLSEPQVKALAVHKVIPGNRPSNTLLLPQLDPQRLGALIALYEHKVFVQSVIWGINAFDQWGVELGKELGEQVYPLLDGSSNGEGLDSSTLGLAALYRQA